MKRLVALVALAAGIAAFSMSHSFAVDPAPDAAKPEALNYTMKDIDGKDVDLAKTYSGKVLLILNVASYCGNTPQYTALEGLYDKYKEKGLVVIGFPANNFGGQEPGTDADIKERICTSTDSYHIKFPMMSKVSVKGDDIAPIFKYLTSLDCKPLSKGDIAWNFEKFLISKQGKLVGRFANRTQPDDPSIIKAIEAELDAK